MSAQAGARLFRIDQTCQAHSRQELSRRKALPIFELPWNHTTLHALRIDPSIADLQVLYPPPAHVELIERMHREFGEDVMIHAEFVRFDGQIACFGLPIVRFRSENRLDTPWPAEIRKLAAAVSYGQPRWLAFLTGHPPRKRMTHYLRLSAGLRTRVT